MGDTIVTVFQSGRYRDGGAAEIGVAASRDAGRTWVESVLPVSPEYPRRSDPVVTFDSTRGMWLASTLGISPLGATALLLNRSANGAVWGPTLTSVSDSSSEPSLDKQWIACDNGARSPFRGRCYLAYTDVQLALIVVRASADGGISWSEPAYGPTSALGALGAIPMVRPNGDLVVVYTDADQGPAVLYSNDGATTIRRVDRLPQINVAELPGIRVSELVGADAAADGRLFAVWHDCSFRPSCTANDVVLSESADGVTWTAPRPLPTRTTGNAFIPTIAVDPTTGKLAVLFYAATQCATQCRIDAWLMESADGRTWTLPLRLSGRSMEQPWIARTTQGRMLADYVAVSYVRSRPVPVIALAEPPSSTRMRQAIFAGTRLAGLRLRRAGR